MLHETVPTMDAMDVLTLQLNDLTKGSTAAYKVSTVKGLSL